MLEKQITNLITEVNDGSAITNALLSDVNDPSSMQTFSSPLQPTSSSSAFAEDDHGKSSSSAISLGKRFIANLIPSSAFQNLKTPFLDEEHFLLNYESAYYVNDKNLSSIVAFTLSSKEYREFQMNANKIDIIKVQPSTGQNLNGNTSASSLQHGASQLDSKEGFNLINHALQEIDEFDANFQANQKNKGADLHFEFRELQKHAKIPFFESFNWFCLI